MKLKIAAVERVCLCVCMCARVCVCVCACARMCVKMCFVLRGVYARECVRACVCVCACTRVSTCISALTKGRDYCSWSMVPPWSIFQFNSAEPPPSCKERSQENFLPPWYFQTYAWPRLQINLVYNKLVSCLCTMALDVADLAL